MLRYLLLAAPLLLANLSLAQSAPTPAAIKFESAIATEICQDLEQQNQKSPVDKLDKAGAQAVLQQVMMRAFTSRQKEAATLYKTTDAEREAVMTSVGQRVAGNLMQNCPTAMKLFVRMTGSAISTESMNTTVTEAERPLLTAIATDACTDLMATNAHQPLRQMPKPERLALVQQSMQVQMKKRATEISTLYGAEVFFDTTRLQNIGLKIGIIMAGNCLEIASALGAE